MKRTTSAAMSSAQPYRQPCGDEREQGRGADILGDLWEKDRYALSCRINVVIVPCRGLVVVLRRLVCSNCCWPDPGSAAPGRGSGLAVPLLV